LDNSALLKKVEGDRDSGSSHTEHQRQELVGEGYAIAA
jgi:hypothetical protein